MEKLVLNCSPLSHFARANVFPALESLTDGYDRFVVREVINEIDNGIGQYPALAVVINATWLSNVQLVTPMEIRLFADYARVLGVSSGRNIGETAILAWAEANGAMVIIDDRAGTERGKERGLTIGSSLSLIVEGLKTDILTEMECKALVDTLADAELWMPCDGNGFIQWAHFEGLL